MDQNFTGSATEYPELDSEQTILPNLTIGQLSHSQPIGP